jgi:flotillin
MHMDNLIFVAAAIAVIIILVLITGYVKAPTDTAVIISGLKKEPKYVIGRSSIKIPFLQRTDKLTLKMISVDVKTEESVPTNDYINVNIDSAVKVKVSMDPEKMKLAASNFLNKNEDYIRTSVVDVLQGNVREIIGQMKLEEIVQDRKKFADKVQENAAPDMAKMGLDIVSFNVQNVTDNGNVIENLGIDRVVSISKSAQISRAESERDIAVAKANAEKEANDAKVASETAIAEQNNALEIKKQELKKQSDIKKAEADAAYEIQEQEQRKTIEIATADANIAKQEKEAEIKEKEIAVREKSLDAEVKKQADAEKYARIQKADADKYEAEQKAEAEKITKMKEAEAAKAQGIAEAEATKAKGMAEAETIRAKGMAEAEAMEKKADAMAKYGKAAMTEMIIKVLPQMAEAIAKPLESIDKVSIIGGAGDSGMSAISDNVPQVLAKTIESVKETTGFDLTEVMKANTYDAKVNNNINVATDFGGKLAENAVKETVTELDSVPADNKLPKGQSNMTPQQKKIPKNKQ